MSATASHRFPCQCLTTTGVFLPHLEHSQVQAELQIYNSPVFIQQYKPNLCQWLYHLKIMSNTPHIRQTYENETLDIWDVAKTFDFWPTSWRPKGILPPICKKHMGDYR